MEHTIGAARVPRANNRKGYRHLVVSFARSLTGRLRLMPDFIIIGAQKCGTTSLFHNLAKHPNVAPCFVKEVHYFDMNFGKALAWYQAHFPSRAYAALKRLGHQPVITGESSPYYLFHPKVPQRVASVLPNAKLLVILRNPLERAYSHYQHEVRKGFEKLSFQDALEHEHERLQGEEERLLAHDDYVSLNHRHFSYLARGIYVDQLQRWTAWFRRDQMLILKSEDFYGDTAQAMHQVGRFLGLPQRDSADYGKYNAFSYTPMDEATRGYLTEFYRPHNQRLSEFLGVDIGWDA
jgi:hypothetical protein